MDNENLQQPLTQPSTSASPQPNVPTQSPSNQELSQTPTLQKSSNKKTYIILILIGMLLVVAIAIYFLLNNSQSKSTPSPDTTKQVNPTNTTQKYTLPQGYVLVSENKKIEIESGSYYETRFSNNKGNNIVIMKLKKAELCQEPTNNQLIKDYQQITVNDNIGCQLTLLDERTNQEKLRSVRWKTETNSYSMQSYDTNISFQELVKIASQIE